MAMGSWAVASMGVPDLERGHLQVTAHRIEGKGHRHTTHTGNTSDTNFGQGPAVALLVHPYFIPPTHSLQDIKHREIYRFIRYDAAQ